VPGDDRLQRALAAIDAANADDPQRIRVRGAERPKELAHAELVSEWVLRLAPEASDALLLAARAHHVRRWEIPRADYPEGRAGYHRWRVALQEHHARTADAVLEREGWDEATRRRVGELVRKRGLGRDPEVQVLEDALCLVFLETQLRDVAARLPAAKLEDVARKTLRKMSPEARRRAAELPLDPRERALLARATAQPRG
jgi:Domain of unknown function (DUF4202)